MKMNVLVTGACGQLGCTFRELSRGYDFDFIFTDVVDGDGVLALDATDPMMSHFLEGQMKMKSITFADVEKIIASEKNK